MSIELGPCEIAGVFGPMASGKTYLLSSWLRSGHPLANRYVRFDVTGETLDDPGLIHIWKSPRDLYEAIKSSPYYFRIAYHPGENLETDFRYALRVLWRFDVYKLVVVDEFHEVCSVNETPRYVQTMLRYARHAHLAVIAASQRIADVHKLFTAGCRKVVIFRSDEARDFVAIRDRWGLEAAEHMRALRPLIYDDVRKVTKQVPQCLVIDKGSAPVIYDFQTKKITSFHDARIEYDAARLEDSADNRVHERLEDSSRIPNQVQREDTGSASTEQFEQGNSGNSLE
jgi:hypothetical protein